MNNTFQIPKKHRKKRNGPSPSTIYVDGQVWYLALPIAKYFGYKDVDYVLRSHVTKSNKIVFESHLYKDVYISQKNLPVTFVNIIGVKQLVIGRREQACANYCRWLEANVSETAKNIEEISRREVYTELEIKNEKEQKKIDKIQSRYKQFSYVCYKPRTPEQIRQEKEIKELLKQQEDILSSNQNQNITINMHDQSQIVVNRESSSNTEIISEISKKKIRDYDTFFSSGRCYPLREVAKGLDIKEKDMLKVLHDNGYIYRTKRMPWIPCVEKSTYFKVVKFNNRGYTGHQTLVKPEGILKIKELMGLI